LRSRLPCQPLPLHCGVFSPYRVIPAGRAKPRSLFLAALDSARTLYALEPARLAAGHGRVIEKPLAAMAAAIRAAERSFGA